MTVPGRRATTTRRAASVLAALALIVPTSIGAAASPTAAHSRLCIPLLAECERSNALGSGIDPRPMSPTDPLSPGVPTSPTAPTAPEPTGSPTAPTAPAPTESPHPPTPTDSPGPTESPSPTKSPQPTEEPTPSESPTAPVAAKTDENAPIYSETPASLGSEALSFTGLKGVSIVKVPTADGGSIRALKISADSITIKGFSLTVRPPHEAGLVTKASSMTLKGHVHVYLGSITATTKGGHALTIGTDTPPPLDDVEPGLLRVTMGLVGTDADSIEYTNTDQQIVDP